MNRERVLVAMSGGVDSSVAAALLVDQGYDATGVTMKLFCHHEGVSKRPCCSVESVCDAQRVAKHLGIPHIVLDLEELFKRDVIGNFVAEYERGRTPVPCVRCNSFTKFKELLVHADDLDCHYVATGHYAIARDGVLYRSRDVERDQTYFLWGIERPALSRMILPLGELTKQETRRAARRFGLVTAEKPGSVEVCFAPANEYMAVVEQHLATDSAALQPGPIVTTTGETVGEHKGYARYTIGQRRGLPGGFRQPMYVTSILPEDQTVVIGTITELLGNRLELEEVNWLGPSLEVGDTCQVCTRYRGRAVQCRITRRGDGPAETLALELAEPVRAITPGQSGVLYDDHKRLRGGGVIR